MKKITVAALALGLLTVPAFAQESQLYSEVEILLRTNGIEITVPADVTNEQLAQIIGILNRGTGKTGREMQVEVENVLGM